MNKLIFVLLTILFLATLNLAQSYNDPLWDQEYLHSIDIPDVWLNYTTGDENVVVAVLGYGKDIFLPDLVENIWNNLGEDFKMNLPLVGRSRRE